MAKFLDTQGISHRLNSVIDNAEVMLYLISPYLQFNDLLKARIEMKSEQNIDFRIIYRQEAELQGEKAEWIKAIPSIQLFLFNQLHAKCYINEKEALVTSMNLHDYSQSHNFEMGIYISKTHDPDLFDRVSKEAHRIARLSKAVGNHTTKTVPNKDAVLEKVDVLDGYCIRTGIRIPFNVNQPFCAKSLKSWENFGDGDYKEKYCHFSGEESNGETCFNKPILKKHWKEARAKHNF